MLKKVVKKLSNKFGYSATRLPAGFDDDFLELYEKVKPFTMTSIERVNALASAVKYIVEHDVQGDFVECGVWKGGSMMAVANLLRESNVSDRNIYLYDTFEGMSEPTKDDLDFRGDLASTHMDKDKTREGVVWARSPIDEVTSNMQSTGYDMNNVHFVKGKVEDTIPETIPNSISLLRLDTDWYESTYHELVHLYPKLSVGGVLIIDDYGHWQGARKAVDEYIQENSLKLLLIRLDYSSRIAIKVE